MATGLRQRSGEIIRCVPVMKKKGKTKFKLKKSAKQRKNVRTCMKMTASRLWRSRKRLMPKAVTERERSARWGDTGHRFCFPEKRKERKAQGLVQKIGIGKKR